jgi:hypothetical protein
VLFFDFDFLFLLFFAVFGGFVSSFISVPPVDDAAKEPVVKTANVAATNVAIILFIMPSFAKVNVYGHLPAPFAVNARSRSTLTAALPGSTCCAPAQANIHE